MIPRRATWVLAPLAGLLLAATPAPPMPLGATPDSSTAIDVSAYPPDMQQRYAVFALKCSKCHTLARPINSRLKGGDWKNYVKKMIRRPGSGINEESGRQIYEFLKYYTAVKNGEIDPAAGRDGG